MTKQEIEQIYYINRELKMWEKELDRLKKRSPVTSPMPHNGSGYSISNPTAEISEHKIELGDYIKRKADELQKALDEAVRFVWSIPDSLTRMIIFYRCVSLMSWRRVAYEVGGNNTEDSVRKLYNRFWEKS